ncbi:DUF1538 family protein [bacterium]|nr:DUF1538 family protein [bacterium]
MKETPGPSAVQPVEVTYAVKLTPRLVFAIVGPYVYEKIAEQVKALLPICLFLVGFQLLVFRMDIPDALKISLGLCSVIMGLMFFIDGLRIGVMPLGENIGSTLPAKAKLWVILASACLLGTMANMAEPAIGTLRILGSKIPYEKAPLLYDYLNRRTEFVLWVVSLGVGLGAMNGIYRFVKGWSLKFTIIPGLSISVILTLIGAFDEQVKHLIGMAWDGGGITTGTVTAPLVLALGVGMASALGKSDSGMSGFGIITLCSIWPIAILLSIALFDSWTGHYMTPEEYAAFAASTANSAAGASANVLAMIGGNFLASAQAILPLIALLVVIQKFVLKEEIRNLDQVICGVIFTLMGLMLFKIGLETGLNPFGEKVGHDAAISFSNNGFEGVISAVDGRYGKGFGVAVVLLFGFLAGYGATLAEPALVALGLTVEDITAGAFKKWLLMHAVGFGVGIGLLIGVSKIIYGWPSMAIILPSYALVLTLTVLSDEKYVNFGWDSGGVTTGDITSPVLISLGLGVAGASGGFDGFCLIAMGSVWPIISVLALGLFINKTTPFVREQKARG